jgi:hypothetical protein
LSQNIRDHPNNNKIKIKNHKKITTLQQTNKKTYKIIYEQRWKTKTNKHGDDYVDGNPL